MLTCKASLPNVRIQTHIFVATKCIRPIRAINLNLLIIKREYVNMKYICENVKAACRIGFTPFHFEWMVGKKNMLTNMKWKIEFPVFFHNFFSKFNDDR